ncbi:hypothetical protein PVAP13_3KG228020 [Panicum virgatum]|uniref:Uncharacterized protein n=1 Tax=Panicum virgatum TaxID=38727 RepID=A0A8T0V1C4_PANVG|nr:hypothetical protein PVAP13_3KG228020 [Panicum virgatum]
MEIPFSTMIHGVGAAGLSDFPVSALFHEDASATSNGVAGVVGSQQEYVRLVRHKAALPDTPQSAVFHIDRIPSFMETPQMGVSPVAGLAGGNIGNKKFDSGIGIWEPDDELLAAQEEEDLDCRAPDCGPDLDDFADDEARVYYANDVKIVSFREPEVVILNNDPYERVYKDLPAGHLVLRKNTNMRVLRCYRVTKRGVQFLLQARKS